MPPNAAFPPAKENGVEATAVLNTLAVDGAPKAAKSVTTLRGGEPAITLAGDDGGVGLGGELYEDLYDVP